MNISETTIKLSDDQESFFSGQDTSGLNEDASFAAYLKECAVEVARVFPDAEITYGVNGKMYGGNDSDERELDAILHAVFEGFTWAVEL